MRPQRHRLLATATLLVATGFVGLTALNSPAAAATNPWGGTVINQSAGGNDPDPVVVEDTSSRWVTDSKTTWSYAMTWQPVPEQASSTDPFNTDMVATASGTIAWTREDTSDFTYKAPLAGDYHCRTVTTVSWTGVATPGNILPTVISVHGQPNPTGGFDTVVNATMSMDDGVTTTVEKTGSGSIDVCPAGTSSSTGPWRDTVTATIHADLQPTSLQQTAELPTRTYFEFAPTTNATVKLTGPTTKQLRGTTVGGIVMEAPGGAFTTTESATVIDAEGNPVPVSQLCIESVWTFTTKPVPLFPVPLFNEADGVPAPIAPDGATWDVVARGLDKKGNNVTELRRAACNQGQPALVDRLHLFMSGPRFLSWTYQPRVSAVTSAGKYLLDVGRLRKGSVPTKKAIDGTATRTIVAP